MKAVALLDTSSMSYNHGDLLIMESARKELGRVTDGAFVVEMPTHTPLFRNTRYIGKKVGADYDRTALTAFDYKFICGTNIISGNLLRRTRLWNYNLFELRYFNDFILIGVGTNGKHEFKNSYTRRVYKKALRKDIYHSVRDSKTQKLLESIGLKALNTGCVTLWSLDEEHLKRIPTQKSDTVVFTITDFSRDPVADKMMISTLMSLYENIHFWPQGIFDCSYLESLRIPDMTTKINLIKPTVEDYNRFLRENECDYVGTRLHGGIKAIQHGRRSIIIGVDNRAKDIYDDFNINYIPRDKMESLRDIISCDFETKIKLHTEQVEQFLSQF